MKLGNPHPPSVFSNKNDHKCPSSDICIHTSYEKHNVMPQAEINFLKSFSLRTDFMNNRTSRFMDDGILWTDVLHFVLLGSLPTDLHLFLPFLVHIYASYISIQRSLIAVLELFTNSNFDPALPGCCCAASESTSPLSHPTAVLPEPAFLPWHFPFLHSCQALTTHPEIRQTPMHLLLPPHCSEPSL